jgi:hypothetical protein
LRLPSSDKIQNFRQHFKYHINNRFLFLSSRLSSVKFLKKRISLERKIPRGKTLWKWVSICLEDPATKFLPLREKLSQFGILVVYDSSINSFEWICVVVFKAGFAAHNPCLCLTIITTILMWLSKLGDRVRRLCKNHLIQLL